MNWKDKFVMFVFIGVMLVLFLFIIINHDSEQPSATDVMTNNGTSIEDIINQ